MARAGTERVLVTGATGFIGRYALAPLVARGYDVHAVCRSEPPARGAEGVTWHRADLLASPAELVERLAPQRLLHLAWYAEPGLFWNSAENLRWVGATLELVRAFAAGGGSRVAVAGTCAEYDWASGSSQLAESAPLAPATLYGTAKQATREVLAAAAGELGVELAWGRVFLLYGPGEDRRRLVSSVARALTRGERAATGDGTQVRDLMHVADVGAAFAAVLDSSVVGPVNIATGDGHPLREVVERIGELAGRPDLLDIGALAARSGEPDRLVAAVDRLRTEVGFAPDRSLDEGLAQTVEWWRAEAGPR